MFSYCKKDWRISNSKCELEFTAEIHAQKYFREFK
jgi:hypothetical protein